MVINIALEADGKYHVTQADGTELAIDPSTVFMPSPDKIYAELDQIMVSTGEVDPIPFKDTLWQAEKSPLITIDSLPKYRDWVMNGSFGQDAKAFFLNLDQSKLIKWQVAPDKTFPVNIGNNQTAQFSGVALLPEGWVTFPNVLPLEDIPAKDTVPVFNEFGFVRLTGKSRNGIEYKNVSVMPVAVENTGSNTVALFPTLVGTAEISSSSSDYSSFQFTYTTQTTKAEGIQEKQIPVPVSKINPDSISDGFNSQATLPYFGAGVDPSSEAKRAKILQDPNFSDSDTEVWPGCDIVERQ
jgi:hypothetical protein